MKKNELTPPFNQALDLTEKKLNKVTELLEDTKYLTLKKKTDDAFEKAMELAVATDELALTARRLPAYTGRPDAKHRMEEKLLDNSPVRIGFTTEGWLSLVIPALLPKKGKGGTQYIHDMLYTAMADFVRKRPPIRFTKCALAVRHIYRKDRPEREYRDHDNIELNMAIDIIARYILTDDGPILCQHHYYSAPGIEDQTEIYIIPPQDFVRFHQGASLPRNRDIILFDKCP